MPALRTEDASALLDFIVSIQSEDFDKSLQRYLTAQELLLTLLARGEWPDHISAFKTLLAPIVCARKEEQTEFYRRFDEWLEGFEQARGQHRIIPPFMPSIQKGRWQRFQGLAWAALGVLVAVCLIVGIPRRGSTPPVVSKQLRNAGRQQDSRGAVTSTRPSAGEVGPPLIAKMLQVQVHFLNSGQPVAGAQILVNGKTYDSDERGNATVPLPSDVPSRCLITYGDFRPMLEDCLSDGSPILTDLSAAGAGHKLPPQPAAEWWMRHRALIRCLISALPLIAFATWWSWVLLRRLALRRWNARSSVKSLKLSGRFAISDCFPPRVVREIAREMCRRVPSASGALAAGPTSIATAKAAGYFTPVFSEIRTAQEYLVLIENLDPRDQQAQLASALVSLLQTNGAVLSAYFYTGDPRVCTEASAAARSIPIQELSALHSGCVLWVFGNAQAFMDPVTGRLQAWTSAMAAWQRRFFFDSTGKPWVHLALRAAGFHSSSLQLAAVRSAVSVTSEEGDPTADVPVDPAMPEVLTRNLHVLFSRQSPPHDDVSLILKAIRRYLGADAYNCFCCCALLPQLSFLVTVALARELLPSDSRYPALQNLVGMPWMRYGSMPDWLRMRLLQRLPEALLKKALVSIKNYLSTSRETSVASGNSHSGWVEFSRPSTQEQRDSDALSDFIYLGALWGFKPDQLAMSSPPALSRLLFRSGYVMFGFRPWIHVALASILSVSLWFGSGAVLRSHTMQTKEDPFLRRVREVSESQVGKSDRRGIWRSPFADWTIDQAAQLLGTATPVLSPSFDPVGETWIPNAGFGIALTNLALKGGFPAKVSAAPNYLVQARQGVIENVPLVTTDSYLDIRPSTQPARKVAVVSTTSKVSFEQVQQFAAAMQVVMDSDLKKYWGVNATIQAYKNKADAPQRAWDLTIEDNVDLSSGPRQFFTGSLPSARVSAETAGSWTLLASCSTFEMLVDPYNGRLIRGPAFGSDKSEVLHLAGVCGPVAQESDTVDGVIISDFVFPRWFYDAVPLPGEKYDRLSKLTAPREIEEGGHSDYLDPTSNQLFEGSMQASGLVKLGLRAGDPQFTTIQRAELSAGPVIPATARPNGSKEPSKQPNNAAFVMDCVAKPGILYSGETSVITTNVLWQKSAYQQDSRLTYTYQASSGTITASGATATLSTKGLPAGIVTVGCSVAGGNGQTSSATTKVTIVAPLPQKNVIDQRSLGESPQFRSKPVVPVFGTDTDAPDDSPTPSPQFKSPNGKLGAYREGTDLKFRSFPVQASFPAFPDGGDETLIVWSPDSRMLATSQGYGIDVWELGTGLRAKFAPTATIHDLAWSPDSKTLASGLLVGIVILYDVASGHEMRSLELEDYHPALRNIVWSPDGSLLTVTYEDGVRVWNVDGEVVSQRLLTGAQQ